MFHSGTIKNNFSQFTVVKENSRFSYLSAAGVSGVRPGWILKILAYCTSSTPYKQGTYIQISRTHQNGKKVMSC